MARPYKERAPPQKQPSLDNWKLTIAKLLRPGFEHAQICLLAAAGAPYMRFITKRGGAIVHFGGAETKAIRAAAIAPAISLWGGVESEFAPIIDDDYANFSNLALQDQVRRFTEDDPPTILIGTSNQMLHQRFKYDPAAVTARLIEVNLFQLNKAVLLECDEIRRELVPQTGFAGIFLATALADDAFCRNVPEFAQSANKLLLLRFPDWAGDLRHWRWAVVAMMLASGALNRLGLIRYDATDALEWLYEILEAKRRRDSRSPPTRVVEQYLSQASAGTLHIAGPPPSHRQYRQSLRADPSWRTVREPRPTTTISVRHEYKCNLYYLDRSRFVEWCRANGHDPYQIVRALRLEKRQTTLAAGYLEVRTPQVDTLLVQGERLGRIEAPPTSHLTTPDAARQSTGSDQP